MRLPFFEVDMRRIVLIFCLIIMLVASAAIFLLTQPLFFTSGHQAMAQADQSLLRVHVEKLTTDFYPRSYDNIENQNTVLDYLKTCLIKYDARVYEQEYVTEEGYVFTNLISEFGPEPGAETPLLLVGAHYDSYSAVNHGYSGEIGLRTHTPGADDNASGVAGLLELARLLHEHPPARPVVLVFYASEEPPFFATSNMGSAVHAEAETRPVELMISLEMIGYFDDEPGSQAYPLSGLEAIYPDSGNFIAVVGRIQDMSETRKVKRLMTEASDLPVYSINAPPEMKGLDFSDHRNYWAKDIHAVMITDTAFYRNPNYHTGGDSADTLDYARMAKVVTGVFSVLTRYDE